MLSEIAALPFGFTLSVAVVLGLLVGSFLNVVILRLPVMMQNTWQAECCDLLDVNPKSLKQAPPAAPFNLVFPHSHCPKCQHKIRFWENIPVISFLLLRGKCSGCGVKISWRYPLVELFTGLASGYVVYRFGADWQGLLALIFLWSLIALTMIDFDTQFLPDDITLPLLWLGLIANAVGPGFVMAITPISDSTQFALRDAVFGAVAGYLFLWSVFWAFKLIAKKEGMGYGDFKLLAALGAWMGWQSLWMIVLISSLVGALYGIGGMLLQGRHKNQPFAFGPFLAIAGLITLFWGEPIAGWYFSLSNLQ
jgi:leader peptidase (prepilin peptidase)/N-methyltransferase